MTTIDETTETHETAGPSSSRDPDGDGAPSTANDGQTPRRRRGFAAMDRDRVKEIASKGGKAAHSAGTAHRFSSDEARVAGQKGGRAPHVRRGGVRRRPTSGPTSRGARA